MKFFLIALSLTSFSSAYASYCDGMPGGYHINPDGSAGGFVQSTASVDTNVIIDESSEVCEKAKIIGNVKILSGSKVSGNSSVEGNATLREARIYGEAKVKGFSFISESEICQGSIIEGIRVIKSNYYCQTEDPQPKDPGEAGKKTLLGVDSDGDGVRDDVEIYINNYYSNTKDKDFKNERINSKFIAKIFNVEIINRQKSEQVTSLNKIMKTFLNCHPEVEFKMIFKKMFNTETRLKSMFIIYGSLHGKKVEFGDCLKKDEFDQRLKRFYENSL